MRPVKYTIEEFALIDLKFREACERFEKAHAEYEIIKEMGKDILANIMRKLEDPEKKQSAVELERKARCTAEWKEYRSGEWAARRTLGEEKAAKLVAKSAWDTSQTGISYKKVELGKLGG